MAFGTLPDLYFCICFVRRYILWLFCRIMMHCGAACSLAFIVTQKRGRYKVLKMLSGLF